MTADQRPSLGDDERLMLRETLQRLLTTTSPEQVRGALADFGWDQLLADWPDAAVSTLFELQGETAAASTSIDSVVVASLAATAALGPAARAASILPAPGQGAAAPGVIHRSNVVALDGVGFTDPADGAVMLVAADRAGELVLVRLDGLQAPDVAGRRSGIDPDGGLIGWSGEATCTVVATGADAALAWERAVAAGRRALAHELVGLSRAMLGLAVAHAADRRQFGRPIGSFQAVKHRLAEAKVALTCAEAVTAEAWSAADEPLGALLAKLWAGRAARGTARHAQQVLGGIGFTWEHPLHRYVRRTVLLDSLLGSSSELAARLGQVIRAGGALPSLAEL